MFLCSIIRIPVPLVGAAASFVPIRPARTRISACQRTTKSDLAAPTIPTRVLSLCAINGTETSSPLLPINSNLLIADLVGLLLAAQLMGLLDVLNDSKFWQTGGWLQPVTLESSTSSLSTLTQRFATTACLYVAGAFGFGAFSIMTPKRKNNDERASAVNMALQSALQGTAGFFILRVVLAIGIIVGQEQQPQQPELALQDVLRDTYFVALATASTRYFVYSLYNRYF